MLFITLFILASICSVQSDGIYGDIDAIIPQERIYIQDLIDHPKPLPETSIVRKCSKYLSVALAYLCPGPKKSLKHDQGKGLSTTTAKAEGAKGEVCSLSEALTDNCGDASTQDAITRQKRQLLTEECCDKSCTIATLMEYCPQYD